MRVGRSHRLPFVFNVNKSPVACHEILISRLNDMQSSLPVEYRNDTILQNNLVNAVRVADDCEFFYHKLADTVQVVISGLHAALALFKPPSIASWLETLRPPGPSVRCVDRRYVKRDPSHLHRQNSQKTEKCYTCGKEGCRSVKHSTKERLKAYLEDKVLH